MWHKPDLAFTEPALGDLSGPYRLRQDGDLVVGVVGQPPPFKRGSGPPLAPITLVPPRDSTAYIIARFSVNIPNENGKLAHKRLRYLVKWPDRPAATLNVDATRVLDYVSPRELEEWEHRESLENDEEERERAEARKEMARRGGGRLRPGRVGPKRELEIDESKAAVAAEAVKRRRGRPAKGPSLSTPQKVRLEDFNTEDADTDRDGEVASPSGAIFRQLYGGQRESDGLVVSDLPSGAADSGLEGQWSDGGVPKRLPSQLSRPSSSSRPSTSWDGTPQAPAHLSARITPRHSSPIVPTKLSTPQTANEFASVPATEPAKLYQNGHREPPLQTPQRTSSFMPMASSSAFSSSSNAVRPPASSIPEDLTPKAANATTGKKRRHPLSDTKTSKPTPKQKPRKKQKSEPTEEQSFVVEGVEDMQIWKLDEGSVRFFKVRWEGDWPECDKTTWEPEVNLEPETVMEYMAERERQGLPDVLEYVADVKRKPKPKVRAKTKMDQPSWPRKKYSSVSEAFEDVGGTLEARPGSDKSVELGLTGMVKVDDNEGDDALLVTEEPVEAPTTADMLLPALDKELARAYSH